MSELDEWRNKVIKNSISDEKEILEYMKTHVTDASELYILGVLVDSEKNLITLQGNLEGLSWLHKRLSKLLNKSFEGVHIDLDETSGLTKADLPMLIQKIDDKTLD